MELLEISKIYIELGILGVCGVLVIAIAWLSFKKICDSNAKNNERLDEDRNKLNERYDKMMELYQQQQAKNMEILTNKIIQGITNHVPSAQENEKLTKVTEEINKTLQQILISTNADRVGIVQYHNGGKGINKQSFLKMSMTNEQVQLGVKPFITEFKDQFRSVISYVIKELNNKGNCYIQDIESVKEADYGTYEFLNNRGIQSYYCHAIYSPEKNIIGFICIEFRDKSKNNPELINQILDDKYRVLETLLNF